MCAMTSEKPQANGSLKKVQNKRKKQKETVSLERDKQYFYVSMKLSGTFLHRIKTIKMGKLPESK